MPTRFSRSNDLDAVVPVAAPLYEDNGAPQGVAYATGQSIGSVLDQLGGTGGGEEALGAFAVEAADIVGQTSGYANERSRILAGLSSAQDRATVERYMQDLARLKNGEIQGLLSPQKAQLYINNLSKTYQNSYPGLALKFRQIHNGVASDVERVSGISGKDIDPVEEALNKVIADATAKGWSPSQQMSYNNAEAVSKAQEQEFAAKARLGQASQADIAKTVLSKSSQIYMYIANDMSTAAKNPNFQGMNWFAQLSKAKGDLLDKTNILLQQAQIDGKFTLESQFQKDLVAQVTAPFDQLIEISKLVDNPSTRAKASDAIRRLTENNDVSTIRKELGPLVSIAGTENLYTLLGDYSLLGDQLKKGQRPTLEEIAKYDPKTRLLLQAFDANGWNQLAVDEAKKVDEETPRVPSGNPILDKMSLQGGLNYVLRPLTTNVDKERGLKYLAGDPDAFEAWDKRPDVVRTSKNFPSTIDALRQNSPRLIKEEADQSDAASLARLRFNTQGNSKAPFYMVPIPSGGMDGGKTPMYSAEGTLQRGSGYEYINPHALSMTNRLNQQYRVFSQLLSPPELMRWVNDVMDTIKQPTEYAKDPKTGKYVLKADITQVEPEDVTEKDVTPVADELVGLDADEQEWANRPAQ